MLFKVAMAAGPATDVGGYSCEFVDPPPKYLQVECPVCLQIVRDPQLISCCGYSFCNHCIQRIQTASKPCPTCNTQGFTLLANKGLQRMLHGFNVRCSNVKDGCKWTGELGDLEKHLNTNPQPDEQLEGCVFTKVKCTHCNEEFKRSEVDKHQTEYCPKRPYKCKYCKTYKTHYDDVVTNHWPVCGSKPVPCPNKCSKSPLRKNLDNHVVNNCPLTPIDCEFPGCSVGKIPRSAMPQHLEKELVTHMSLLMKSYKLLKSENRALRIRAAEVEPLRERVSGLEARSDWLQKHVKLVVDGENGIEFTLTNVSELQKERKFHMFQPFYTCFQGYKMLFEAGFEKFYLPVCLYLMQGEFDSQLEWPLIGSFKVQILNQETSKYMDVKNHSFSQHRPAGQGLVRLNDGNSYADVVRADVPQRFLKNDSLRLRLLLYLSST